MEKELRIKVKVTQDIITEARTMFILDGSKPLSENINSFVVQCQCPVAEAIRQALEENNIPLDVLVVDTRTALFYYKRSRNEPLNPLSTNPLYRHYWYNPIWEVELPIKASSVISRFDHWHNNPKDYWDCPTKPEPTEFTINVPVKVLRRVASERSRSNQVQEQAK